MPRRRQQITTRSQRSAARTRSLFIASVSSACLLWMPPVSAQVAPIGDNLRISSVGTPEDPDRDANQPAIAYDSDDDAYLAVYWADHGYDGVHEILGTLLTPQGDPINGNQFFISAMSNGDTVYDAFEPDVVFAPSTSEYLVVWHGDDHSGGVDNEFEIYAQILSGSGAGIGGDIQVSDVGPPGDTSAGALRPAVAHDPGSGHSLIVWFADEPADGLADGEFEIYGQLLDNDTGGLVLPSAVRISDMGTLGDPTWAASEPDVAFDPINDRYLVVWQADDNEGGHTNDEFEIYGAFVSAQGIAGAQFRISQVGPVGSAQYGAFLPAVAFNEVSQRWMVLWHGDHDTGALVDEEYEVFGRTLSAQGQLGTQFRVSRMGGSGNAAFGAARAGLVAEPAPSGAFLATWFGDDGIDGDFEIHVQRVGSTGVSLGPARQVSSAGGPSTTFAAFNPAVAVRPQGEALVVWSGTDDTYDGIPSVAHEYEIRGQLMALPVFADGFESGSTSAWSSSSP